MGNGARERKESKMSIKVYAHPFSSYCQKVFIALYENAIPFELRMLAPGDAQAAAEHEALWPVKRMPVLVDDRRTVVEASVIIEHLGLHHPGPVRLIPEDPHAALDVRMMDRFFDNYIMTPMQRSCSTASAQRRIAIGTVSPQHGRHSILPTAGSTAR
jgi:glutathione S-transferase